MSCPGFAEATAPLAAVPLVAAAAMPVKVEANAALVPPSVVTVSGPVGAFG